MDEIKTENQLNEYVPNKENIPEDEWWYCYYSRIFVGQYQSAYNGHIDDIDKDPEISSGEWYDVYKVIGSITKANAIAHYIDSNDERESTDTSNDPEV